MEHAPEILEPQIPEKQMGCIEEFSFAVADLLLC